MQGFVKDIEEATVSNTDFCRVLYTGKHLQLVLMALMPGEQIGEEVHISHDQFFRVEEGTGAVVIDERTLNVFPHNGTMLVCSYLDDHKAVQSIF